MTVNNDLKDRFEFGKNWLDFIKANFNSEQVEVSKKHILNFLGTDNLDGKSVLDIGCGSGLHSVAMLEAGASLVHGFDYDENSVKATQYIQSQVRSMPNWTVEQGSVLDDSYINGLPKYDLVYSWGVLHHTGEVWRAIKNAATRVADGGDLYIALYAADVQINPTPEFWLNVKKTYISSLPLQKKYMEFWYIWRFQLHKNPLRIPIFIKRMLEHKKKRGMNIFTDIRDWLGGWPMEFVYDADVINFCKDLGFQLKKISTGEACSEFYFTKIN